MTRAEAILEARRKLQAGDFRRAVVEMVPEDLDYDRLILECGHTKAWSSWNSKLMAQADHSDIRERCTSCAEEWIVKNSDAS